MTGLAVTRVINFEEKGESLRELADVRVRARHVERAAEALGAEITMGERAVVDSADTWGSRPDPLPAGMKPHWSACAAGRTHGDRIGK
jgi:hypothetical protein